MAARARKQEIVRAKFARSIAEKLATKLRLPEEQTRMYGTNRVIPPGNLKRNVMRKLFGGWVCREFGHGSGRIFTLALARDILCLLRDQFGLPAGHVAEVKHLQSLLTLARKRNLSKKRRPRPQRKPAMAVDMDNMETQLMEVEANLFCIFVLWIQVNFMISRLHVNRRMTWNFMPRQRP